MLNPLVAQIQDILARYVAGAISASEFQAEFAPISWSVEQHADRATESLVYSIELRLAEFTNGHLAENEMKQFLQGLLAHTSGEFRPLIG